MGLIHRETQLAVIVKGIRLVSPQSHIKCTGEQKKYGWYTKSTENFSNLRPVTQLPREIWKKFVCIISLLSFNVKKNEKCASQITFIKQHKNN